MSGIHKAGLRARSVTLCVAFWTCLALLSLGTVQAAEMAPLPAGSSLRFQHIGIEDGLAQSSAQVITQDHQGYIWIGTEDGLQRYDGYEFLTFHHDPARSDSLADDDIVALAVGRHDALWIGTYEQGLDYLDPGSRHFTHYRHDPARATSLASNYVFALLVDKKGSLWVGTDSGLDRLDNDQGNFRHYPFPSSTQNGHVVFALHQDAAGRLWIGMQHGLYYYDAKRDAVLPYEVKAGVQLAEARELLTHASINAMASGNNGELLVATESGLVILSPQGRVEAVYRHQHGAAGSLPSSRVRAVYEDRTGDIWLGTFGGGVARLDRSSRRFDIYRHDATDSQSLAGDRILTLFGDRTGLVWIGTQTAGISLYNPRTREFGYYRHRQGDTNSLVSNLVWSIYKDRNDRVWVGTDQGLTRMDASRLHYRQYQLDDRPKEAQDDAGVYELYGDRAGRIWAGTDYGLYEYLPEQDRFRHFHLVGKHQDSARDAINAVYEDAARRFWIGTAGGLAEFDRASGRVVHWFTYDAKRADSLPDNGVTAICEAGGYLWVGTVNGLARFDGVHDQFTVYRKVAGDPHSLSASDIQSCMPGSNDGLWVGTVSGLNLLDTGTGSVTRYSTRDGLPNDAIYAILVDRDGKLWISTANGLSEFNPASGTFRNYGVTDGLQSLEFNGASAYAAADGELFFGGINGFNAFYPKRIHPSRQVPDIAITGFVHAGREQALFTRQGAVNAVTVPYRDNILTFFVAAFDYVAPMRNQFKYRLDGFDRDWHTLHGRHDFTYTNLDPGHYVLEVQGSNSDGVWSNRFVKLGITVLPPAWRTWWAYLLYAALTFVLIVIGLKLFAHSVKREQILVNEHQKRLWAETLHNLIQSITTLRDERAIAEQLVDVLANVFEYERVLFYMEENDGLELLATRGFQPDDQPRLERWPIEHSRLVLGLRRKRQPGLLSAADAATLDGGPQDSRPYLAVPLSSGGDGFRLLLASRQRPLIERQAVDIVAAMAKQVNVALDNARLIHELESLATTDSLTRLYNRRHFLERAEAEFERSRRYQRPLSVFLLDVDHFKQVNDTLGHNTGDQVLRMLAGVYRQNLRQLDVIGRYGGEEFVVFLPETSIARAMEVAERVRRGVEEMKVDTAGAEVRVTVSIGVAMANEQTESIAALINEADRALYEAKRAGRNRVVLSRNDPERSA
ncbi:MAG TPA: diguanylate cyclase [Gammaproteobacteria bacterium]|nr:diguanylate cyclase [Gammaproteobacteria bacterium]